MQPRQWQLEVKLTSQSPRHRLPQRAAASESAPAPLPATLACRKTAARPLCASRKQNARSLPRLTQRASRLRPLCRVVAVVAESRQLRGLLQKQRHPMRQQQPQVLLRAWMQLQCRRSRRATTAMPPQHQHLQRGARAVCLRLLPVQQQIQHMRQALPTASLSLPQQSVRWRRPAMRVNVGEARQLQQTHRLQQRLLRLQNPAALRSEHPSPRQSAPQHRLRLDQQKNRTLTHPQHQPSALPVPQMHPLLPPSPPSVQARASRRHHQP